VKAYGEPDPSSRSDHEHRTGSCRILPSLDVSEIDRTLGVLGSVIGTAESDLGGVGTRAQEVCEDRTLLLGPVAYVGLGPVV
jgi:hypothetical protein